MVDATLLGLDPLFLTNIKLTIHDVLDLEQANEDLIGVYKLFDHKIKLADICGTVVAVERNNFTTNYTVDDGTGTMTCIYWSAAEKIDYKPLPLGTSVRITGKISTYRDQRQIVIYDIYPTFDPNQELLHFVQAILLKKEYEKHYNIPRQMETHVQALVEQIQADDEDQLVYSSQASKLDKPTFDNALLRFYKSSSVTTVTLDSARDDSELERLAVDVYERIHKSKPSRKEISDMFRAATDKWLKAGYIIKEGRDNIYNVVDEEDLAKAILKTIKEMSKQLPDQLSGIRGEYIGVAISSDEMYSKLHHNSKIIDKVVDDLVEQSLIYPTGHNEYKVFL